MNNHITASGKPLKTKLDDTPFSAVETSRRVLRRSPTGSLATLDAGGAPFASFVTTATTPAGEPLVLLSDIAVHTKNLRGDARVSLLLVEPGGESGDPLAGSRVSVIGTIAEDADEGHRRRFLARHGEAKGYATFRDFRLYRIAVTGSHMVAGFGRIVDLPPEELLTDCTGAEELIAAEEGAIKHMNEDHADALALYATRLLGMPEGKWTATGADPDGLDMRAGQMRARLAFPARVRTGQELRAALVQLAKDAREAAG